MKRMFRKFWRNEEGTTAVEFGLVSMGFLALLFSIIETGRFFLTWNAFQYAFENATRTALVNPDITAAEMQDAIVAELNDLMLSANNVTITVTFSDSTDVSFVDVDGVYNYDILIPLLPSSWNFTEITAHSRQPRPET